jgi:hypothetical protein
MNPSGLAGSVGVAAMFQRPHHPIAVIPRHPIGAPARALRARLLRARLRMNNRRPTHGLKRFFDGLMSPSAQDVLHGLNGGCRSHDLESSRHNRRCRRSTFARS